MNSVPIKAVLVMDHPAQHFARAFQLLGDQPEVELQVCYWSAPVRTYDENFSRRVSWDVDLLGGYKWTAPDPSLSTIRRMAFFLRQLRNAKPDVIICYGWGTLVARLSILYCAFNGARLLLYGDTTWQHSSSGNKSSLRSAALRVLMHLCAGAVSTGTFNREFYIQHGMDPRRIFPGVCPADTELFGQGRDDGPSGREASRDSLRIGFAGKLIARKGPDELVRAAALLPRTRAWSVTLVGDGPMMRDLQSLVSQLELTGHVTFHGFANTTEMPKLLASFDVVVVPSRLDMRALITIEAMAAGAVVVVSDATAVWGSGDLIEEAVSGLVYRSGDPADLACQLGRMLDEPSFLAALRQEGVRRSVRFGPSAFARTMARATIMCSLDANDRNQDPRR